MTVGGCLIPIRGIRSGKQRIRATLPQSKELQISSLISLILNRILRLCSDYFSSVWIMTRDPADVQMNLKKHVDRIFLDPDASLNNSLALAAKEMASIADSFAVITPDLPLLQPGDISQLLDSFNGKDCVIAPSKDGGTSGLIIPLDNSSFLNDFKFQFSVDSFSKHLEAFSRARSGYQVVQNHGFLWDLDDLEDLQAIMKTQRPFLPEKVAETLAQIVNLS